MEKVILKLDMEIEEILEKYNISTDEVLSKKKPAWTSQITGIYFLIDKNEVVYVGKSVDIYNRISTHSRDASKIFDSFSILECPTEFLKILETHYIFKLRPFLNNIFPEHCEYKSFVQLKKLLDVPTNSLKIWIKFKRIKSEGEYYLLNDFQDFEDFKLWLQKTHNIQTTQCSVGYVKDYLHRVSQMQQMMEESNG